MGTATAMIESLRRRLNADGRVFNLREAIDAFEESYRHDRLDDTDSLTIVGWPKPDVAAFDLALGRCIGGGPCEFPTIVTIALLIPITAGELFETEVDDDVKQLEIWQPGHVFLQCKDWADADTYFPKVRHLAVVQKYGDAVPISCRLDVPDDNQKTEIALKLADYFAEHGWPCENQGPDGSPG